MNQASSEDVSTESVSEADTRNASSSSISGIKHTTERNAGPLREVVYVDQENRQVKAWVSGLMNAATFRRYARREIRKGEKRDVIAIDDQTDGAKAHTRPEDKDVDWKRSGSPGWP